MSEQDEAKSVKPTADNKKSAAAALFDYPLFNVQQTGTIQPKVSSILPH